MKILVVIVVLIAAFKADCRHFSDQPTNQVSNSEERSLPDETLNRDFHDEDQNISFEFENPDSTVVDDNTHGEIVLRGKGDKKNLQKLIKNFEFLKYNLTQDNLKMKTELQSLRDNQNNISDTITNGNKELKMDLNLAMENITNGDLKLKAELQSIIAKQNNITHTNKNLNLELQSLVKKITDSNSGLKTDVNSMNSSLASYNSDILSKLKSIEDKQECPEGFFHFSITNQCFKIFTAARGTWHTAKAKCLSEGLVMAKPYNQLELRNYIVSRYGCCTSCWVGARGTGSDVKWERDGEIISSYNTAWISDHPAGRTSSDYCIEFLTRENYMKAHPTTPYFSEKCTWAGGYPLCELV